MPQFIDLTGQKFSRLTVVRRGENDSCNFTRWVCRCACGNEVQVRSAALRSGETRSCGCWKVDIQRELVVQRTRTHGQAGKGKSRTYTCWVNMKQRCSNPKATKFAEYGGRGIKVCARWQKSFEAFLADMGPPPSPDHSIDRRDNDGDYTPKNCRWAIEGVQMNNMSTNRTIEHAGRVLTLQEWSRETGIPRKTISNRLDRLGWTVAEALTAAPSPISRRSR